MDKVLYCNVLAFVIEPYGAVRSILFSFIFFSQVGNRISVTLVIVFLKSDVLAFVIELNGCCAILFSFIFFKQGVNRFFTLTSVLKSNLLAFVI